MLTPLFNRCAYKNSVALALIGAPGHGKTALIEEWCRVNKRPLVKLLASCLDETDVAGVMVPRGERAVTLSPNWVDELGENGVLFCDELNTSRREVQDTLLTIIQSRHMPNGEKLPKGVMIVAAMNPAEMCDNYEMSPAMRTRFMWCKYSYGINKFVAWFTGQNVSTISASKYQAPTDHQTFDEWLSLFRESSEFEADKKALLFEAVKLGLDFTPDLDFADKDHATCPRNLANLTYWTRNASEMVQFAPAFIDEKEVNILKSVPMTCYKNVGNSIFKNTRKQTEQGEAENELLEQRKGLFDTIQQEVDQAE